MSSVVLLKTHVWNPDLEQFCRKLLVETKQCQVDFHIIIHDEDATLVPMIGPELLAHVHPVTEAEIKTTYPVGFFTMWLSNHWLLMYFYQKFGAQYDYIWCMEYDVRIVGNSAVLWKHQSNYDFLYTMGNYRYPGKLSIEHYTGPGLQPNEKIRGYLQLCRYSKNMLSYLDSCFASGENGQDELIIYSLCHRGKLSSSNKFLRSIIKGKWTWQSKYAEYNRVTMEKLEAVLSTMAGSWNAYILHPVK